MKSWSDHTSSFPLVTSGTKMCCLLKYLQNIAVCKSRSIRYVTYEACSQLASYLARVLLTYVHITFSKIFLASMHMVFLFFFLKSASTTLSLGLTFSISLLHFFIISSLAVHSLNRLIFLWRRFEEQPTSAQFSPGVTARLHENFLNIAAFLQLDQFIKLFISVFPV